MWSISKTPYGTLGRDLDINKVFWPFLGTHKRNNNCRDYICSEEPIEAHMLALVDFHTGWTNAGDQPYFAGKDWR